MDTKAKATFNWYEFIPHVLAALAILCCVIVFAAVLMVNLAPQGESEL